jgi:CheY-like chemotaxis protein/two-component sensor histidine kinase
MDYTRNAETAAKSLLRLLNDILDFSKIDANKLVLDPHPFQLDQLAQELSVLLHASALEKNISLKIDLDPRIAPWIVGDAFRLMQVLTNLVSNAIKFTDIGQVMVTMRPVSAGPESIQIRFEVRDSGIGISAENLQHVFDDFAQAEASTTRRFGGTGLGLTICKRLVHLMGGSLEVSSVLGQGSTFSFELRFAITADVRAKSGQSSIAHDAGAPGNGALEGMRVLVVEDNALNQRVVRELLAMRGASITVADDGAQGVDAVAHAEPMFDVVLMDVQMPVMDGYAATRAIRENLGLASLPIIGLTANAFPADREACLSAGMNGHLGKPFEVNALVAQILQCAGGAARVQTTGAPSDGDLAQYPVIDVTQALGRMGNMRSIYSGAAAEFKVDLAGLNSAIQGFASLNDMKALQRLLHTAKGNAGTVGLIRLSQELGRLDSLVTGGMGAQDLLREAQPLQSLVQEADCALTAALAELSA